MLSKLLKHEFAATWKPMVALDAALLLMGLAIHLMTRSLPNNEGSLGMTVMVFSFTGVYYIGLIAANIVAMVLLVMRYYRNLYTAEGYLTFTLPVSTSNIIATKAISGFVWMLLSYLCTTVSVLTAISGYAMAAELDFLEVKEAIEELTTVFDLRSIYIMAGLFYLITPIATVMILYLCVSIGQLWQKHKVLGAVLAYVGLHMFNNIVNQISLLSSGFFRIMMTEGGADPATNPAFGSMYSNVMYRSLLISAVEAIVAYIICVAISKKKLNLD